MKKLIFIALAVLTIGTSVQAARNTNEISKAVGWHKMQIGLSETNYKKWLKVEYMKMATAEMTEAEKTTSQLSIANDVADCVVDKVIVLFNNSLYSLVRDANDNLNWLVSLTTKFTYECMSTPEMKQRIWAEDK